MNNFDDIFESAAASGQPDTRSRWQVRQQQNRENAYAMIDAALEEISQGKGDVPGYLDIQARFVFLPSAWRYGAFAAQNGGFA